MTSKPHQRAHGPNDQGTSGINAPTTTARRAAVGTTPGRTAPRDTQSRRAGQMKVLGANTMDYQQGFFSGPSS